MYLCQRYNCQRFLRHNTAPSWNTNTQALKAQPLREAKAVLKPGLPNAYQVSHWLYRGGQPTRQGYEELVKMGIKTVVNLRVTPQNKKIIEGLPLTVYQVPLNPVMLNTDGVEEVLKLLSNPANYPIYLHCRYGSTAPAQW